MHSPRSPTFSEADDKPQKSLNEKQQENQELLIRCISQHLGFSGNRPVAACIIYKCLLQWRSFEVERTSVFDRIIQTIGHAIEVCNIQFFAINLVMVFLCRNSLEIDSSWFTGGNWGFLSLFM